MGRSDTIVAQVTAPATDPSLRKLPRSIQFQGHTVSISVSRSLQSKTEQRNSHDSETLLKQQRRRAKQARRKINLTHGYDERDLYVKQNRQHTMVPTKTQATKPVHFHSAKTAQSSDQPNTRCRGGKAQSNKHYQGKL
ncbi:hypothetical protein ABBQ32_001671 [Trebouxia sp. C0010 RCD-2024]